jgi:periplasmic protein CpxP/Spy
MKTAVKLFATAAAVVAAVSFSSIQASAFMGSEGMPPTGRQFKKMAAELGLSAQQQDEIKKIISQNRPLAEPMMKQLRSEHRALRNLVQADTFDEAAIRAQVAKAETLQADLAVQRAKLAQQVRAILTPEQIQKFRDIQARRDGQMDKKRMHGGKQFTQDN